MYAVIKTGGKQYSVKVGDTLKVEKLTAEAGTTIKLGEVLYVGGDNPIAGAGVADTAKVEAEVLGHGKHDHIRGFVYKPKKHTHRHFGHRQPYTEVRITGINV